MRLSAIAVAGLATLAIACGPAPRSPAPTGVATAPPSGQPAGPAVVAYFYLGSDPTRLALAPVTRAVEPPVDPPAAGSLLRAALDALLAGPTNAEAAASPPLRSGLPGALRLLDVELGAGVATVDLSEEINDSPGDGDFRPIRARLAQIVFTVTQFPEVTGVLFRTDGVSQDVVDRDGNLIFRPLTRDDYADELAPIFVDTPAWGATVSNPLALEGLADVFEAQFRFRLLAADGRSLADGPLTAECGSGCRGAFGVSVPFSVQAATQAHLQVFDLSEADGSVMDFVDYPLTLLP